MSCRQEQEFHIYYPSLESITWHSTCKSSSKHHCLDSSGLYDCQAYLSNIHIHHRRKKIFYVSSRTLVGIIIYLDSSDSRGCQVLPLCAHLPSSLNAEDRKDVVLLNGTCVTSSCATACKLGMRKKTQRD